VSDVIEIVFISQTILQKFLIKIKGTGMYKMNCNFKQTKKKISKHERTFHSDSISYIIHRGLYNTLRQNNW
jgi:hypothetical protein